MRPRLMVREGKAMGDKVGKLVHMQAAGPIRQMRFAVRSLVVPAGRRRPIDCRRQFFRLPAEV